MLPRPMSQSRAQARAWCATLWSTEEVDRLRAASGIKALVIGEETCPETKKVHFQTYVRFATNKRFSWWKNEFPQVHVEIRKGTEEEAAAYCRKDGKVLHDFGCEVATNKSGDTAEDVLDMLEDSAPDFQIYREHRKFFFYHHAKIESVRKKMKQWTEEGRDFKTIKASAPTPPVND